MAKTKIDLGGRAYLFTGTNYAANVVISAHGFYRSTSGVYQPGNRQLTFYCDHGATVDDVPMSTQVDMERVKERVPGDNPDCTDYLLFKFQEHSGELKKLAKRKGWTYDEAEDAVGNSGGGETYATFTKDSSGTNDYVTVRNRAPAYGGPVIKLSALIALIEARHAYATYKCCFCRELKPDDWMPKD